MIKDIVNDPSAYLIDVSHLALTPEQIEAKNAAMEQERERKLWEERTYRKLWKVLFGVHLPPTSAGHQKAVEDKEPKYTAKCVICEATKGIKEFPTYKSGELRTKCHTCLSKYSSFRYQVRKRIKKHSAVGAVEVAAIEREVAMEIFPEHWRNVLKRSKTQ